MIRIEAQGLKELRRALKAADAQLPREMRKVLNQASAAVVAEARARVPRRSGDLAGSIRAQSTQTSAQVKMGTPKRVPYAGFIEFGGRVGKGRTGPGTGSVKRPFVSKGRYLYPAFERRRAEVIVAMKRGLNDLARTIEEK